MKETKKNMGEEEKRQGNEKDIISEIRKWILKLITVE